MKYLVKGIIFAINYDPIKEWTPNSSAANWNTGNMVSLHMCGISVLCVMPLPEIQHMLKTGSFSLPTTTIPSAEYHCGLLYP